MYVKSLRTALQSWPNEGKWSAEAEDNLTCGNSGTVQWSVLYYTIFYKCRVQLGVDAC